MARPKVYDIKGEEVTKLASYGCTNKEIADFYGCSADLIEKSYSEVTTKGRSMVKIRLRQLQLKAAENGSAAVRRSRPGFDAHKNPGCGAVSGARSTPS